MGIRRLSLLVITGLFLLALLSIFILTRDGRVVPTIGTGTVEVSGQSFEAYPLPDYAKAALGNNYVSYLIEVEPGVKVHMLEIGSGYPVYMQHGNPTSALLWRRVVDELPKDKVRVILPTMVGLGFSSKVPASQHTLDNHINWIKAALEKRGVKKLVYVGQDWGGPIGMGVMARSPEMLQGVVAMNTAFAAPIEERDLSPIHAAAKTPIMGEIGVALQGVFNGLDQMQGDPESMSPDVESLYARPVEGSGNGKAPLALLRMVPDGPDHPSAEQMREIEAYVKSLNVPAEIVWGMKDPILGPALPVMQQSLPSAMVTKTDAGHFLQEEVPIEIAAAIMRVVERLDRNDVTQTGSSSNSNDYSLPPKPPLPEGVEVGIDCYSIAAQYEEAWDPLVKRGWCGQLNKDGTIQFDQEVIDLLDFPERDHSWRRHSGELMCFLISLSNKEAGWGYLRKDGRAMFAPFPYDNDCMPFGNAVVVTYNQGLVVYRNENFDVVKRTNFVLADPFYKHLSKVCRVKPEKKYGPHGEHFEWIGGQCGFIGSDFEIVEPVIHPYEKTPRPSGGKYDGDELHGIDVRMVETLIADIKNGDTLEAVFLKNGCNFQGKYQINPSECDEKYPDLPKNLYKTGHSIREIHLRLADQSMYRGLIVYYGGPRAAHWEREFYWHKIEPIDVVNP